MKKLALNLGLVLACALLLCGSASAHHRGGVGNRGFSRGFSYGHNFGFNRGYVAPRFGFGYQTFSYAPAVTYAYTPPVVLVEQPAVTVAPAVTAPAVTADPCAPTVTGTYGYTFGGAYTRRFFLPRRTFRGY